MTETFDKVKALIAREFGIAPDAITPATQLESLGVDSLAALEFAFLLEDLFHVTMDRAADLRGGRVQDVVDIVNAALATTGAAPGVA